MCLIGRYEDDDYVVVGETWLRRSIKLNVGARFVGHPLESRLPLLVIAS
jgi:hypothetical protein